MVHMRNDLGFHLSAIAGRNMEGDDDSFSIDRLSSLPEAVIHHILSFLDTKSAVQTSVLSRQWRCAWKHLSVLEFDSDSFDRDDSSSFKRYVEKVLSLRYQLNLSKVIFLDRFVKSDAEPSENSLFARVSRYALSHGAQHLGVLLDSDQLPSQNPSADLLGFNSDHCSRLKSLQLQSFSFSNRFQWSGFVLLRILDLSWSAFIVGEEDVIVDPFSNLPCLKHLGLRLFDIGNNGDTIFRISGLQLLSLCLVPTEFCKMEIHAPKLKYFFLEYIDHLVEFTELTLPCLDHAHIRVALDNDEYEQGDGNGYIKKHMIPLFHGLNNATSLVLGSDIGWLLGNISDYLEDQPSPFRRLKSLTVSSSCFRDDVSFALLAYFCKGSSHGKPVLEFMSASTESECF